MALDVIPNETNKGKFKFLKIVKKTQKFDYHSTHRWPNHRVNPSS